MENLATLAKIEAVGKDPAHIADGIKGADGRGEWVTDTKSEFRGMLHYPELKLTWNAPPALSTDVISQANS